jgi:Nuclease-related domain
VRLLTRPRRQQVRQLARTAAALLLAAVAGVLALAGAVQGATALAAVLGIAAGDLVGRARRWARLARRSGVGARSEQRVRRALAPLRVEGWRLRHALSWDGRGHIDHVAIAPRAVGLAFVIETKTQTYSPDQLVRTAARARWIASRRRRWSRRGAVPVLCVMRPHRIQRAERGVLVVSIDRLTTALRQSAGTRTRPAFLARDR